MTTNTHSSTPNTGAIAPSTLVPSVAPSTPKSLHPLETNAFAIGVRLSKQPWPYMPLANEHPVMLLLPVQFPAGKESSLPLFQWLAQQFPGWHLANLSVASTDIDGIWVRVEMRR